VRRARGWDDRAVTTVLIVDDSGMFRTSARLLLEDDGFEVVGEAEDGAGALAAVERLRPALVLLDVQLGDDDGFDVARTLAAQRPAPAVVLVSTRDAVGYAERLQGSPARGFISKADLSGERLAALIG
jgi:DNA-binding NarL/FixJ family response regulator